MDLFDRGGLSWGLGRPGTQVAQWPRLFTTWARTHGFMAAPPVSLQPLTGATVAPPPAVDGD